MPSPPAPCAVEVQNLRKFFRVPGAKPRGRLNRIAHPVQRGSKRTLRVLDGVSFDVKRGELFGIVGRNGSGKSTLLRVLGSIYSADAGIVRITGTLAPFIELGVGFQPQMSARQNVAMNGVLLGLDRRDVKHRVDEVLAYAELEDFADVQLKNFSSGMRVRLAFASMLQADPDIYLIDEILAVGDEAFREKCMAEFATLKERNKTILMVTHRHGIIQDAADRALVLREGVVALCGEPTEVLDAYRDDEGVEGKVPGEHRGRLRDDDGERKRAPKLRATVEPPRVRRRRRGEARARGPDPGRGPGDGDRLGQGPHAGARDPRRRRHEALRVTRRRSRGPAGAEAGRGLLRRGDALQPARARALWARVRGPPLRGEPQRRRFRAAHPGLPGRR